MLASLGGGISLYSPDGVLKDTFAAGSNAGALCFSPNGDRLVAPGAGLFDRSGSMLTSSWSSLASSYGECAVDGSRHVYVAQGPSGYDATRGYWSTIRKYTLTGTLLRSYTVAANGVNYGHSVPNLDLAPDQCTLYYDTEGGDGIYRFNACTNTQLCPLVRQAGACDPYAGINGLVEGDQLRVLPTWQVAEVFDHSAATWSAGGESLVAGFGSAILGSQSLRWLSLDPDGTSFWVGTFGSTSCGFGEQARVWQLDIASQTARRSFGVGCGTSLNGVAVENVPLIGDAEVGRTRDANPAGVAEAFPARVTTSGQLGSLNLYVDASSSAKGSLIGIYSDRDGHPGKLATQATMSSLRNAGWNHVDVPSLAVSAGERLWIAILTPEGQGTLAFRDGTGQTGSEINAQRHLTDLPKTWSTGTMYPTSDLSAFGN